MAKMRATGGYGPVQTYKDIRSGFWYARFRFGGKREHFKLTAAGGVPITRKDVADEHARDIAEMLQTGQWGKLRNRREARVSTFREVTDEFLVKGCRWSESTRKGCQSSLNRILKDFGNLPIADITADTVESHIARRRDEGMSKGTRNRELSIFKAILKKAREWGYVAHNAAADVTTEREGKKQPQPYTREELSRLLAELQPRHRDIMTLYLHTGLRRGEMMKLRWADVDFEANTLTVRAPKNDDDRTIPLSEAALDILQGLHSERGGKVVDLRVFGDAGDIRKVLDRAAIRVGIEDGRRHRLQHRLRDTCATTLLDAGVALDRVQVILGHRDIGMTRRYAETRPEALREAIAQTFASLGTQP
jgi:integrase